MGLSSPSQSTISIYHHHLNQRYRLYAARWVYHHHLNQRYLYAAPLGFRDIRGILEEFGWFEGTLEEFMREQYYFE